MTDNARDRDADCARGVRGCASGNSLEEAHRTLVARSPQGMLIFQDGRFVFANEQVARISGRARGEFLSKTPEEAGQWVHEEDRARVFGLMRELLDGGKAHGRCEFRLEARGRGLRWVELDMAVREYDGRPAVFVYSNDVTERKRAEEALRAHTGFLRQIIDTTPACVYVKDGDGRYVLAGKALADLYGIAASDIEGRTDAEVCPDADAAQRFCRDDREVIETRQTLVVPEESLIDAQTGRQLWFQTIKAPLVSPDGRTCQVLGVSTDITARKEAEDERRLIETRMQEAQRLESLGVLAGGIAHEYNNLLAGILGNAEMTMVDPEATARVREGMEKIQEAALRASRLTRQMLAFSGQGRFVMERVKLCDLAAGMTELMRSAIPKKIALEVTCAEDAPAIEADPSQIRQVVMNLVSNASEAIGRESGTVYVAVAAMDASREYLEASFPEEELAEGRYALLEVTDTGCGMDEATRARLFEPFFTTKSAGRGLGLAAVLGIVHGHGGAIHVESAPGQGTTVRVLLPVADEARGHDGFDASQAGAVLVVDDETIVREVAVRILERAGFSVMSACDGREAVEVFRAHAHEIACVLLDVTMPNVDGPEALEALRAVRSDVRVLLSSGYTHAEVDRRVDRRTVAGFVAKPYRAAQLVDAVRRAIGDGA